MVKRSQLLYLNIHKVVFIVIKYNLLYYRSIVAILIVQFNDF
jgi:hypothetical protein